jgi:hypothetical protein
LGSGLAGLAGQGADLDQVVGEYSVAAPDGGSVPAVQAGAVPAVAALEVADPAFASGSPLDQPAEAARRPQAPPDLVRLNSAAQIERSVKGRDL